MSASQMEKYIGTKFKTVFFSEILPKDAMVMEKIRKLIYWGKKFSFLGLTPAYEFGAAGNLSFRTEAGFIITGTGKNLGDLKEEDFSEVMHVDVEKKEILAKGNIEPSSEAMLHHTIYENRPEVKFIFHVHDDYVMLKCDELGLRCTENEKPYGTVDLALEVIKVLGNHDYIVIKNHGIISLGSTSDEAGDRILEINGKVKHA